MNDVSRLKRAFGLFATGIVSSLTGYMFTILYLKLTWLTGDPRYGLPFLWFIPHGIEGLHFHHDIEFFLAAPVVAVLAARKVMSRDLAFVIITFFLGMALHHWHTEGLVIVSFDI